VAKRSLRPQPAQHRQEPGRGSAGSRDDEHDGGDGREHQEQAGRLGPVASTTAVCTVSTIASIISGLGTDPVAILRMTAVGQRQHAGCHGQPGGFDQAPACREKQPQRPGNFQVAAPCCLSKYSPEHTLAPKTAAKVCGPPSTSRQARPLAADRSWREGNRSLHARKKARSLKLLLRTSVAASAMLADAHWGAGVFLSAPRTVPGRTLRPPVLREIAGDVIARDDLRARLTTAYLT
jgi:hypothetical protein